MLIVFATKKKFMDEQAELLLRRNCFCMTSIMTEGERDCGLSVGQIGEGYWDAVDCENMADRV